MKNILAFKILLLMFFSCEKKSEISTNHSILSKKVNIYTENIDGLFDISFPYDNSFYVNRIDNGICVGKKFNEEEEVFIESNMSFCIWMYNSSLENIGFLSKNKTLSFKDSAIVQGKSIYVFYKPNTSFEVIYFSKFNTIFEIIIDKNKINPLSFISEIKLSQSEN